MVFTMGNKIKLVVFLLSILAPFSIWAEKVKPAQYVKYVNEIINEFNTEMARDYNLICSGSGGGMPYGVEEIDVEFYAFRRATIEEARELEVKATQRLLDKINQNTKIRPFLREYPFKPFRAEVSITFADKNGHWWSSNSLAYVFQVKDKIYYFKKDNSRKHSAIEIHSESFEEAEKIVAQSPPHDFKGRKI